MARRWRQVLRTPVGATAGAALFVLCALAVLAPLLLGDDASAVEAAVASQGPSADHWLGTDALGRDMFARILVATRSSLVEALTVTLIGAAGGVLLGGASAVLGRRLGRLLSAFIQMAVAFPGILLAMFLAVIFGTGVRGAVLALGISMMPLFARLTQTLAASVAGQDYVAAARGLGVRWPRLLVRHVLPNVAEPLVINLMIAIGGSLLALSALSFLGLGAQPPEYDWGRLLNENLNAIYVNPAAALGAGAAVVLAGASFNLAGDAAVRVLGARPPAKGTTPRPEPMGSKVSTVDPAEDRELVLRVQGLNVRFPTVDGSIEPVRDVGFEISAGETVGIVGESGSGKTLTSLAVAGLVPEPGEVEAEGISVCGERPCALGEPERRALLARSLAIVFQDPGAAFNPVMRVGRQLAEIPEAHGGLSRSEAAGRAVESLGSVDIPEAARRVRQYPHEYSGGMLQRAMIAMSLMASPRLIIADEPTSGLDVTVQRRVLRVLQGACRESGAALVFISHDVATVSHLCERVLVMYGGTIVEDLPATDLLAGRAKHPYTRALLAAVPDMATDVNRPLATIPGRPPEPADFPSGCPFAPRCQLADARCNAERPPLDDRVACWHPIGPEPVGGRPEGAGVGR